MVQSGALEAVINLLQVKDAKVILVILEAINNMFMVRTKLITNFLNLTIGSKPDLDQMGFGN